LVIVKPHLGIRIECLLQHLYRDDVRAAIKLMLIYINEIPYQTFVGFPNPGEVIAALHKAHEFMSKKRTTLALSKLFWCKSVCDKCYEV